MIPIEDHKWKPISAEYAKLPEGHRAEYARTGDDEFTARIVGANAHVFGQDETLWDALEKAVTWFEAVGEEL